MNVSLTLMGDSCYTRDMLILLHGHTTLFTALRNDINIDHDLLGLKIPVENGSLSNAWKVHFSLFFFDNCLYVSASYLCLHELFNVLLHHGGENSLHQVVMGLCGLPHEDHVTPT